MQQLGWVTQVVGFSCLFNSEVDQLISNAIVAHGKAAAALQSYSPAHISGQTKYRKQLEAEAQQN